MNKGTKSFLAVLTLTYLLFCISCRKFDTVGIETPQNTTVENFSTCPHTPVPNCKE